MTMETFNLRRRRKAASSIVRASLVLTVVLITAFVLHHPVNFVLRQIARLPTRSGGTVSGRGGSADGRSLTGEARVLAEYIFIDRWLPHALTCARRHCRR